VSIPNISESTIGPIADIDTGNHPAGPPMAAVTLPSLSTTERYFIDWLHHYVFQRWGRPFAQYEGNNLSVCLGSVKRSEQPHYVDLWLDAIYSRPLRDGEQPRATLDQYLREMEQIVKQLEHRPLTNEERSSIGSDYGEGWRTGESIADVIAFRLLPVSKYRLQIIAQCRVLAEPYFSEVIRTIKTTWLGMNDSGGGSKDTEQNKPVPIFRHVFDNAEASNLRDWVVDYWQRAWDNHEGFRVERTAYFTYPPKLSPLTNGVTTVTVRGFTSEPPADLPPDWKPFEPKFGGWDSSDWKSVDLEPVVARLRDLGSGRTELVAECQDPGLASHFRRWLDELARLWSEATPAIERYLGCGSVEITETRQAEVQPALKADASPEKPKRGGRKRNPVLANATSEFLQDVYELLWLQNELMDDKGRTSPTPTNADLAKYFGVSEHPIYDRKKELGWEGNPPVIRTMQHLKEIQAKLQTKLQITSA
jgi:hypothetical protein